MQLHDIFPAVKIVDYSLYWLLLYLMLGAIGLSLLWRYLKRYKRKGIPYYLNILEHFDTTPAKQVAYKIEYYGTQLVKTEAQTQTLHRLIAKLTPYKYLQDDVKLPETISNELRDFLQTIRRENV